MSALQWVRLLAALSAAAQCGAVQEGPAPDPGTSLSGNLDLLWTVVDRAVKSAVEPLIAEINTRLDSVQTQTADLASRLTSIEARQQTQTTDLASRLTSIEARQQTQTASLEGIVARQQTQTTDLASRLTSIEARQQTQTAELDSRLTSIEARQQTQTASLTSFKSDMVSRLDGLPLQLAAIVPPPPRDCTDLPAASTSGIYTLQLSPHVSLPAFCDFDTDGGGWIVIQRRADIQPRQNFHLGWQEYQQGFGELDAEFWWGLQNLWTTTSLSGRRYQLRIDLGDWSGEKRYAVYQTFTVSSESDGYRLTVSGYSGDAGDHLSYNSGSRFSTRDKDQDGWSGLHCAARFKSGWWYKGGCGGARLNGPYLAQQTGKWKEGIIWYSWKGASYSLKTVEMKIRPAVES